MPFSEKFQDIYTNGIKKTLEDLGWACHRADEKFDTPEIICTICKSIQESSLIIADLTGRNPNVFLEVGLAFGLEKHVIFLTQNSNDIPFDTRTFRTLIYNPVELEDLKNKIRVLVESIKTPLKTSKATFEKWCENVKRIREIPTEPLMEIFIGPEKETTEWLPVNKENLNLMMALPYVFENKSVEPRRGFFEFTSRSPKIFATMNSQGFFHAVIPLILDPQTKKYYLDAIVYDIGEILFFAVRIMKKKAVETEQRLKVDFHGIRELEVTISLSPFPIRSLERSFSKKQDYLSYEKTFDPKEKWSYFFNLMCEIYKDIITDLGIIDINDKTVKQHVRHILQDMHYLRTSYPLSGLENVSLKELFEDVEN